MSCERNEGSRDIYEVMVTMRSDSRTVGRTEGQYRDVVFVRRKMKMDLVVEGGGREKDATHLGHELLLQDQCFLRAVHRDRELLHSKQDQS
jgi:hypothetical protein